MNLPEEEKFQDVCADVVIRFKGHGSYKGRAGALKAFKKRTPGYDSLVYEGTLDNFCEVYDLAVKAIELFPAKREKTSKYSEFEDINFEKSLEYINQVLPEYGKNIKDQILNWVIFWHYLK